MRRWWIAAMSVVAACAQSGEVRCPDPGEVCPAGTLCVTPVAAPGAAPSETRCVSPEALEACAGEAPACGAGGVRACYASDRGPVCLAAGCGNGLPDVDEPCDDGNNSPGDGCSADCRSNETCGNGVIDALRGERCDDGDHLSHDGCSSRCGVEAPAWEVVRNDPSFVLDGAAVTFDARRGRLVIFGGLVAGPQGSRRATDVVSEWDGGWHTGASALTPGAREGAALAYDERRGVTVMFGGLARQPFADTWEWTGSTWRSLDVAGPPARSGAAMNYDPVADRVVLFGGAAGLDDTWTFARGTWTRLVSTVHPPAAEFPALTYDRAANRVALVVGGEHWELAGDAWARVGTIPLEVIAPRLVFDPRTRARLLFGVAAADGTLHAWAWTGQAWVERSDPPPVDSLGPIVADPGRGRLIVTQTNRFGGGLEVHADDGWHAVADPPPVNLLDDVRGAAAAVDALRHEIVMFGGLQLGTRLGGTYIYDGAGWREVPAGGAPAARDGHAMAYDPVRHEVVLFGGTDGANVLGDTWVWDGLTWSSRSPALSPSARVEPAMAFDPVRARVVLFGGADELAPLGDTWEWDGVTWTPRPALGIAPPPRQGANLVAVPGQPLLLFGGRGEGSVTWSAFADTWQLDGAGWHALAPAVSPPGRAHAAMAWNPARQRVTLNGGEAPLAGGFLGLFFTFDDLWEWNGALWQKQAAAAPLAPLTGHVAVPALDGAGIMVLSLAPARVLRWSDDEAYETCQTRGDGDGDALAGCADPDCWPVCDPLCPPGSTTCAARPVGQCGEPACAPQDSPALCPLDCGPAPVSCGDLVCDGAEPCAGDCPAP